MAIKRNREEIIDFESSIAMAKYLILLSSGAGLGLTGTTGSMARSSSPHREFECKTCNRKFPSFQALGGHRASHKKPKPESMLDNGSDHTTTSLEMGHNNNNDNNNNNRSGQKPKTAHECSICGVEFAIGQALGGHMRRHRAVLTGSLPADLSLSLASSRKLSGVSKRSRKNDGHDLDHNEKGVKCLDLNLTPLENGLLEIGLVSPILC